MLKKHAFLLTIFYSLALALVCLLPLKELPDIGVSFGDKIFHSLTYVVLAFLWFYALLFHFKTSKIKSLIYAAAISIVFGIVIEILQGTLTKTRQADVFDVLANSVGVSFAVFLLWLKNSNRVKKL